MCGIAGLLIPEMDEATIQARLDSMLSTILHRGPDSGGCHVAGGIGLGARRLSIIDLPGGQQPIWNEDHTIAVVFNGEIYNYLELRHDLVAQGHALKTQSDTEVLVHLFEQYDLEMFPKLRGMFAFALIDTREHRLILARDHFGQKPLYYSATPKGFLFASEIKAIFASGEVSRDVRSDGFLDYVAWFVLPPPETHFAEIHKLEPGCCLIVRTDVSESPKTSRFWSWEMTQPAGIEDVDQAAAALERELHESVALHLRSDVPIGVLLSGGLDSRCVAAQAQEITGGSLTTFSVGFGGEESELPEAAKTAREIGSYHYAIEMTAADLSAEIDRVAWHLDEPIGDPAALAVMKVCQLAKNHVKVLLSGEGADELFAGYGRYPGMLQTIRRSEWLRRFMPELRKPSYDSSGRFERLCERLRLTRNAEEVGLRIEGLPGDVRSPRGLTAQQLARLDQRKQEIADRVCQPQRDLLSELLRLDARWQLAEGLLQKADKMSMAASIELRTPFLDVRIAALAAAIHSRLKLPPGGPGKYVLRKCLAHRLNESMDRPKLGFPVPLRRWLTGELREQIHAEIFASSAKWKSHLDKRLLTAAWDDFQGARWDGSSAFYALWLYEVWMKGVVQA